MNQSIKKRNALMQQLDDLRVVNGGDLVQEDSPSSSVVRINKNLRLAHVMSLLYNTLVDDSGPNQVASQFWMSMEVAVYLAIQNFNRRRFPFDASLKKRVGDCDLRLTVEFHDSQLSGIVAGRLTQEQFFQAPSDQIRPSIILGPVASTVASLVATLSSLTGAAALSSDDGATLSKDRSTPVISPTAASSRLDNRDMFPYFARTISTNAGQSIAICTHLQQIGVKNIGVMYVRNSWGEAYMRDIAEAADERGISYAKTSFTLGIDEELHTAADFLKNSGMKYFILIFHATSYAPVLSVLHEKGIIGRPDVVWYFNDFVGITNSKFYKNSTQDMNLARALNGTGAVSLRVPPATVQDLNQMFDDEFKADPQQIQYFASNHTNGPNFTSWKPELSTNWAAMNSYDAATAIGIAACNAQNDLFTGPELYDALKQVDFNGASGRITLDATTAGTRNPESSAYTIFNMVVLDSPDQSGVLIPHIVESSLVLPNTGWVEVEPFRYPDGTTTAPLSLAKVKEDLNLVGIGVLSFVWILTSFVLLFILCCAVWTVRYKERHAVKKSQPFFLLLICAGAFIMTLSIVPSTLQEPLSKPVLDAACMARPWLLSVGLTIAFAAIFSKIRRIYEVYQHAKSFRKVEVKPRDVLGPFLMLFTVNVVIFTAWTIDDPLRWSRIVVSIDSHGRVLQSYGTCHASGGSRQNWYFLAGIVVNLGALFVANYQSYKAKELPIFLSEKVALMMTNFFLLEILLLGFPVLVVVSDEPTAFLTVYAMVAALLCFAVMLPIFLGVWHQQQNSAGSNDASMSDFMNQSSRRGSSSIAQIRLRTARRASLTIKRASINIRKMKLRHPRNCPESENSAS